jgi:phosphoribosylformylglycinamidine synthase
VLELAENKLLKSAHDCSDGGLATALAESCFGRNIGCTINLPMKYREDFELFGESQGRIIISIDQKDIDLFENICMKHGQKIIKIGFVKGSKIVINESINLDVIDLKKLYESVF